MARVTEEDKIRFNELYYKYKNKSRVARETGFSTATVSKYIIDGYIPAENRVIKKFQGELPDFSSELFHIRNWSPLILLSETEKLEMYELWKEMDI